MRCSGLWSPALVVALVALPRLTYADEGTVALAIADRELTEALGLALSPLGLEVVSAEDAAAGLGSAERDAALRATAEAHEAVAVVWIDRFGSGYLLSAYAAASGAVKSRPLRHGPPYDEATAVAVAFSIKTLLREGSVIAMPTQDSEEGEAAASEEEREEASADEPERSEVAASAEPVEMASEAVAPPTERASRVDQAASLASRSWLWLDLGADLAVAGGDSGHATQLRAGVTLWPATAADRLGISLTFGRAATVEADHDSLEVDFSAVEAGLGARLRLPFGHRFALMPEAGVALRLTRLGSLSDADGDSQPTHRTSSVAEGALVLAGFVSPRFALALSLRFGFYLWPVQYTWQGEPILEEPWTRSAAGVRAVIAL